MKKITSVLLTVAMLMSVLCMTTQAASGADSLKAEVTTGKGVVVLEISAAEAATNGKFTVNFDADCLLYTGCDVEGILTQVEEDTGALTISFATTTAEAVAAGRAIIEVRFLVMTNWHSTDILVTVFQFNEHEALNDQLPAITVKHPGRYTVPGEEEPDTTPDPIPTPSNPSTPSDPTPEEGEQRPGINIEVPELTEERYHAIVTQYPDAEDHWAEENIVKAINAGLFNGTSENTFTPNGVVTRGMFVTLLYRLSGEPEVGSDMPFTDVASTQYYADAVIWAYSNNIVNGVTATEFAPNKEVSREQMVTMLYRYAKAAGEDADTGTSLKDFGDTAAVSSWALEAMSWAVGEGIITGSGGNLNPGNESTRAQIATVLVRYAGL